MTFLINEAYKASNATVSAVLRKYRGGNPWKRNLFRNAHLKGLSFNFCSTVSSSSTQKQLFFIRHKPFFLQWAVLMPLFFWNQVAIEVSKANVQLSGSVLGLGSRGGKCPKGNLTFGGFCGENGAHLSRLPMSPGVSMVFGESSSYFGNLN